MATSIERLLKQKGWTGQEVGILAVTSSIIGYLVADGKAKAEDFPSISGSDIRKMLNTLEDPDDIRTYAGYIDINRWLAVQYATANAIWQQVLLRYTRLTDRILNAQMAERVYEFIDELPLIVTEKQYQDIVKKRTEEILHPNGEPVFYNLFEVMVQAIDFYVTQLKDNPKKKNPLAPLKGNLEKEPVTDPDILAHYNKYLDKGYFLLEDGTRSDEFSKEKWEEIYKAMPFSEKKEWHYYEDPPEKSNKWEVVSGGDKLGFFFTSLAYENAEGETLEDGSAEYKEAVTSDAIAFKKEFPSVVQAILEDMEKYFEGVSSIPVEEWADNTYSLDDLHQRRIYGFQDETSEFNIFNAEEDYSGRAINRGVAVLKRVASWASEDCIDKAGYYRLPKISEVLQRHALEGLFPESEYYADNLQEIDLDRKVLLDSIYFLNGYNKALELIRKRFKIDALKYLELDDFSKGIDVYNNLLDLLSEGIRRREYEDEELMEKKQNAIKYVLKSIDLASTKTPEAKIKIAKEWLKRDFDAFKKGELDICILLCQGRIEEKTP